MTNEQQQNQAPYFGLDIGYSSVKVAYGTGRVPEVVRMPVGAGPIASCKYRLRAPGPDWRRGVGHRHQSFLPERLFLDEDYSASDEYRALDAALFEVNSPVIERLVTGLPVHLVGLWEYGAYKEGVERGTLERWTRPRIYGEEE